MFSSCTASANRKSTQKLQEQNRIGLVSKALVDRLFRDVIKQFKQSSLLFSKYFATLTKITAAILWLGSEDRERELHLQLKNGRCNEKFLQTENKK